MLKHIPFIIFLFFCRIIEGQNRTLNIIGTLHESDGTLADHQLRLIITRNNDTLINQISDSLFAFHLKINYDPKDSIPLIIHPVETNLEKLKPFSLGPCPWNHFNMYALWTATIKPGFSKDTFILPELIQPWPVDYDFAPSILFYNNSSQLLLDESDSLGNINRIKLNCFTSLLIQNYEANLITYTMDNSRKSKRMALRRAITLRDYFIERGIKKEKIKIIIRDYYTVYPNEKAIKNPFIMIQMSKSKKTDF